jgi:hypothetical protein
MEPGACNANQVRKKQSMGCNASDAVRQQQEKTGGRVNTHEFQKIESWEDYDAQVVSNSGDERDFGFAGVCPAEG